MRKRGQGRPDYYARKSQQLALVKGFPAHVSYFSLCTKDVRHRLVRENPLNRPPLLYARLIQPCQAEDKKLKQPP